MLWSFPLVQTCCDRLSAKGFWMGLSQTGPAMWVGDKPNNSSKVEPSGPVEIAYKKNKLSRFAAGHILWFCRWYLRGFKAERVPASERIEGVEGFGAQKDGVENLLSAKEEHAIEV